MSVVKILDLTQPQSGCDDKQGGVEKWWIARYADIASITWTAKSGSPAPGYEISAITMNTGGGFAEVVFSDNKTAFINETAGNTGEPGAIQASCEFEGISAENIWFGNQLKKECAIVLVGQNKTGIIRVYGIEPIDITANTYKKCQDPLRAKVSTVSGNGSGDYEKMTIEIVGAAKSNAYSTKAGTLDADDFDALNFS
jgi:hypothetical protein